MKKNLPLIITISLLFGLGLFFSNLISKDSNSSNDHSKNDYKDSLETLKESNGYVDLYFFYGDGCPHCADEKEFLANYVINNPKKIKVHPLEVWYNQDNAKKLNEISKELDISISGVPFAIIGDKYVSGFGSEETSGKKIKNLIESCYQNNCTDNIYQIIYGTQKPEKSKRDQETTNNNSINTNDSQNEEDDKIALPFEIEIDPKDTSLPILTFVLALFDGFNPCAMWVLMYLISMLVGMKDKKKMWILGTTFIVSSAFVYFLFMTAWLKTFQFLGMIEIIRIIIGIVAIGSGIWHLKEFKDHKEGCKVVKKEKRKKIFSQIKQITTSKKLIAAMIGISALAFSVNLIELVCSAGLPAIYTNILSNANLNGLQYYTYLLFYIFIFMLDDLVVFFIAMTTLRVTGISNKYQKWVSLIGGIVIFVLGILLIFKPGWIMFG